MVALVNLPPDVGAKRLTHGFYDDHEQFVTGDRWTSLVADAGSSVAVADAVGGQIVLTTGATDNNEVLIKTTKELFLFAPDKPLMAEWRSKYAEANTDDANVFQGLMDAIGANAMLDDGAGPKASFSGCGFFKVDGATRWSCISSLGSNRTTTDLSAALSMDRLAKPAGSGAWQLFRIDVVPVSSTVAEVCFYIDDVLVAKHSLTFTSATEMQVGHYIKAGGANSEVLTVDYTSPWQKR